MLKCQCYPLRYLKFKYRRGDADARFSHSLQMTSYAKEVHDIQAKRISTDWY